MTVSTVGIPSGIGVGPLPDVGTLEYNGIEFSCLYTSRISADIIQDEAKRATKWNEYTLSVEGVVTLPGGGATTTDDVWDNLRTDLAQPAAPLFYSDKGFGRVEVNVPGGTQWDCAWGPVPRILHFQPLGAGRAAFIRWEVVFRLVDSVPELAAHDRAQPITDARVLAYTFTTALTYDERGYAGVDMRGVLEVPLTRTAADERSVQVTVDAWRERWLNYAPPNNFKVTHRSFEQSPDRRTLNWSLSYRELPPMGLPPGCMQAGGMYSVRNVTTGGKEGGGNVLVGPQWGASLRCTYTVRADEDRRVAWLAFYAQAWFRMWQAGHGGVPGLSDKSKPGQQPPQPPTVLPDPGVGVLNPRTPAVATWDLIYRNARAPFQSIQGLAFLTSFGFDEGLYEDSYTITFNASWILMSTFANLMAASGAHRWMPGSASGDGPGGEFWAISVGDITGWKSWSEVDFDPAKDLVVDLGIPVT